MAGTLYDPAFAALSYHTGEQYRRAVTVLTLFGGFASTVFWPLSQLLLDAIGWRWTFGAYALLHLAVCLPIHALCVPAASRDATVKSDEPAALAPVRDGAVRALAAAFALATFVQSIIAVHLIPLLTDSGLTPTQAVTISMLVGPMQVAGRVGELVLAGRVRPVHIGAAAFVLMALALVALMWVHGAGAMPLLFVTAFGAGNGLLTIARGTVPAELYGRVGLGALLGYLARAAMAARAVAPVAWPALLALGLTRGGGLGLLVALAGSAGGAFAWGSLRGRARGPGSPV
jgi:predicted MFS family arabinose efflux permease